MKKEQVLFYLWLFTLAVIVWGAWVRISHSGDGCGDHWPLCGGEFLPEFNQKKTWVEYMHRVMSGLYGLGVLGIFFWLRKSTNRLTRQLNWWLFILMIIEALLGAVLVKAKLVTVNDSFIRLIVMSIHQVNSFLLTGLTFTFWLQLKNNGQSILVIEKKWMAIFIGLPVSGAVAALSTTLFPAKSLLDGLIDDISTAPHFLINIRILHPLFAVSICLFWIYLFYFKGHRNLARELIAAFTIGVATLLLLSPHFLKLTHLLVAHLIWARFIYTFVSFPDSSNRYRN